MKLFIFPGQGSQKIGMGLDSYNSLDVCKNVFLEVEDALSIKISDIMFYGNEEDLKQTQISQVAIMTVGIAYLKALELERGVKIDESSICAGHSLGEYTALCASGALSLRDAATILWERGKAMNECSPQDGVMAAILGLSITKIEDLVNEISKQNVGIVEIANDNSDGQVVISGNKDAVSIAIEKAKKLSCKMAIFLNVSGPFHSSLMTAASKKLQETISKMKFNKPICPIISNVTAKKEESGFEDLLLKQVTSRVRWRESMINAEYYGAKSAIEIGEGRVLSGLMKRIPVKIPVENVDSMSALKDYKANLE